MQQDVDSIPAPVDQNLLLLNALICCYLLFSRKSIPTLPPSPLFVNDAILHMVKQFKYLGVTFSSDATWSAHIISVCLRARRLIGMLYRKLYCYADTPSLLKLYLTTVRPHLEYASSVWDPYLKKDIEAIERVQKFGLKVCLKNWHCSYDNLLNIANIPTLASRRQQLKLGQLFNIINGYSVFPDSPAARSVSPYLSSIRSTNSATLTQNFAHTTLFQNYFFPLQLVYGTHYPRMFVRLIQSLPLSVI